MAAGAMLGGGGGFGGLPLSVLFSVLFPVHVLSPLQVAVALLGGGGLINALQVPVSERSCVPSWRFRV
jgi:hypothetical protein